MKPYEFIECLMDRRSAISKEIWETRPHKLEEIALSLAKEFDLILKFQEEYKKITSERIDMILDMLKSELKK